MSLVVFCCNFSTLQQKPHDYICSACKNMVSQKMYVSYWATVYNAKIALHVLWHFGGCIPVKICVPVQISSLTAICYHNPVKNKHATTGN